MTLGAPGRPDAQNCEFYNKVLIGTEDPRAAGAKSEPQHPGGLAGTSRKAVRRLLDGRMPKIIIFIISL